jgi:hypothetical protein
MSHKQHPFSHHRPSFPLDLSGAVSITLTNWMETHFRRDLEGIIVTVVKETDFYFILYGKHQWD